ncbi:GGDEF domain-containing protein [Azospirillum humicireducens]|uniref:diguanylate cyclase n=1 Tax=Azospirillum humicireducens TaxID=1226968 RepID=A0A160JCK2_9PROT|nr:diguanylate cyclase [Azospirillum humicireducens]ANC90430.1 GGDEF domain-containing protein [Azospirillum humicireducens]
METNILVADDSEYFREQIRADLESNGYRVLLAEDGAQALAIYRSHDIHILITDLEMPVMTGLELCWHVRAEDDQHRTFTILMTGDTETVRRIEAFDSGADEFLAKPIDLSMLRARVRAGERITRMHRVMVEMLHTDYLTGVLNRRYFMERLEQAYRAAKEEGTALAVAMFDLDHFKTINDTHGHSNGDLALKRFADHCAGQVPDGGFLGRLGGEEFCLCLPAGDLETALAQVEAIRRSTAELMVEAGSGASFAFTVSIGMCLVQDTGSVNDLMTQADEALYFAKRSGRNRTVLRGAEGVTVKARFYVM